MGEWKQVDWDHGRLQLPGTGTGGFLNGTYSGVLANKFVRLGDKTAYPSGNTFTVYYNDNTQYNSLRDSPISKYSINFTPFKSVRIVGTVRASAFYSGNTIYAQAYLFNKNTHYFDQFMFDSGKYMKRVFKSFTMGPQGTAYSVDMLFDVSDINEQAFLSIKCDVGSSKYNSSFEVSKIEFLV